MREAAAIAGVVPSSIRLRYPVVFGARLSGRELRQVSGSAGTFMQSVGLRGLGAGEPRVVAVHLTSANGA